MVSRRTRVAFWIFRRDHPSRPKAMICCFFSSFKTFACERLLTLPLLSMSWSILLKVWPLFRCSCMAAFGCSLRRCVGSGADGAHQRHARLGKKYGDTAPQVFQPELCTKGKGGSSRRDT